MARLPDGLCRRGWHAIIDEGGKTYVRFASRMGDANRTFIYRIGPAPLDGRCVTVWCYEDKGVAWTCSQCGRAIVGFAAVGAR